MKKFLFLFALVFGVTSLYAQSAKLDKAKVAIRNEFKNTMNDYQSYVPVSFGAVDSLFTSLFDDKAVSDAFESAYNARHEADLDNISFEVDLSDLIVKVKENPDRYKEGILLKLMTYETYRKMLMKRIEWFVPEFIGWKIEHKYRAKNQYNATILYNRVFYFDKNITTVISIKDVDE